MRTWTRRRSIGASIDGDAPRRTPAWLLADLRGQAQPRPAWTLAQATPRPAQRGVTQDAAPRGPRQSGQRPSHDRRSAPRGALGELQAAGDRPQAPWHPLPLSELLILAGAIGAVVAYLRGIESNGALLGASIGAVVIGTIEVTLREHLSGYRSHTLMLSRAARDRVPLSRGAAGAGGHDRAPGWLNVALLPLDVALFAVLYKLLRARYVDARRERTFAGLR